MADLEIFQTLKKEVLLTYQKHYPYFTGNWKNFSSQDIQNLIVLIEENIKQTISEKWIYTHLKPETNLKLPRKDMLDILSQFCGFSGWDEFAFLHKKSTETAIADKQEATEPKNKNKKVSLFAGIGIIIIVIVVYFLNKQKNVQTIELKDAFTKENLKEDNINAYTIENNEKVPLAIENSQVRVEKKQPKTKVFIESPYYKKKEIELPDTNTETKEVLIQADDYAMMLKAFMKSDIKDWETRKVQLDKILSDNLEVIVMLKDDLGAEYFNKKEFSEKLIVPTASIRKMKVLEIKKDSDDKIEFIRIKQE